jgi:hypothetical protein
MKKSSKKPFCPASAPKLATILIAFQIGISAHLPAVAHDGHGLSGAHWHASDAWGYVALAVAVAVGVWLSRGKK